MAERYDTDVLFKALADPSRRKLLDLLHAHDGRTLNELCEHLDMTRQGVTRHLDLLEVANLVSSMRRGREKLHFLNPVPLQEISASEFLYGAAFHHKFSRPGGDLSDPYGLL